MKRGRGKPSFILPLIVLAVLFLILGGLFRIESVETSQKINQTPTFLTVMPRSETNFYLLEQEARDELDDPTIMSLPHQKLGFSQVLVNEGEPPQPNLPVYKVSARSISGLERARVPLVGVYKEPDAHDGNTLLKPVLPSVELIAGGKTFTQRVVWLEDGKEKLCPVDLKLVKDAAKGVVPTKNTKILFKKLSKSYVYFLVGKCGVAELDNLVLEYVQTKKKLLYTGDLLYKDLPGKIEVDWRLVVRSSKSPE
ncbi:MAG: hypothetical protein MK132_09850 [Lentisphaerales bacterium]|nr:hypothetical protein [Lentisphaerales bacterium]